MKALRSDRRLNRAPQRPIVRDLGLYAVMLAVAFAISFAVSWYFPAIGTIWLVVGTAEFLFSVIFSRRSIWAGLFILIVLYAAVFSAAALH